MDNKEIIEYLKRVKRLDDTVNLKIEQLSDLIATYSHISVVTGTEKVKKSLNTNTLCNSVAKLVDLENDINKDIDKLVDLKREIIDFINSVGNKDCQKLLMLRYIQFISWEDIAEKMHYSLSWIFKAHKKAISLLANNNNTVKYSKIQ